MKNLKRSRPFSRAALCTFFLLFCMCALLGACSDQFPRTEVQVFDEAQHPIEGARVILEYSCARTTFVDSANWEPMYDYEGVTNAQGVVIGLEAAKSRSLLDGRCKKTVWAGKRHFVPGSVGELSYLQEESCLRASVPPKPWQKWSRPCSSVTSTSENAKTIKIVLRKVPECSEIPGLVRLDSGNDRPGRSLLFQTLHSCLSTFSPQQKSELAGYLRHSLAALPKTSMQLPFPEEAINVSALCALGQLSNSLETVALLRSWLEWSTYSDRFPQGDYKFGGAAAVSLTKIGTEESIEIARRFKEGARKRQIKQSPQLNEQLLEQAIKMFAVVEDLPHAQWSYCRSQQFALEKVAEDRRKKTELSRKPLR